MPGLKCSLCPGSDNYAANLAGNGIGGALGPNWMHNFDVSAAVEGDAAIVTLFGGNTIGFQRDGQAWTLTAGERLDHQLVDGTDGGLRFLDLSSTRIYSFDAVGRLIEIADRNGNALAIVQGASGPTSVSDGLGRSLTLTYSDDRLTRLADQTGRSVSYGYTDGELTTFTDSKGAVTTYTYAAEGDLPALMSSTTEPEGEQYATQTFDADGRVAMQTDGVGNTTAFSYDQAPGGAGSRVTDPRGKSTLYAHTGGQNQTATTDAEGGSASSVYSASNSILSYTDPMGNTAVFDYHQPSGFPAQVTDFSGATWRMAFTMQQQDSFRFFVPAELTFPDRASETYEYDARGNLTGLTDRAGDTWSFTYNDRGQMLTHVNPVGGTARFTANGDGSLAMSTDGGGFARNFAYDALKRIQSIQYADGSERTLQVDSADRITAVTDEAGRTVRFEYDDNNRIGAVTDPLGNARRFSYDGNGRLAGVVDRAGATRAIAYDPAGNVGEVTNGAGESVRFVYDGRNQLTSIADAIGTSVNYMYDANGRVTSVTDPLGNTGTLTLDQMGRVRTMTPPTGDTTNYIYDRMGRLRSIRSPTGELRQFQRDARGNLSQMSVADVTGGYKFNGLGELETLTDPNGGAWQSTYGGGGRRMSLTDPLNRRIDYGFDARGRRNRITTPLGRIDRTFDAVGNIIQANFFDGTSHSYSYDGNSRLLTTAGVTLTRDGESRIVNSNGIGIAYDAAGRIQTITYADGKDVTYKYDERGRLIEMFDWAQRMSRFSYDAADRLTRIQRANGVTTELGHDDNHAISSVRHSGLNVSAEVTLERDAAGNISSATIDAPLVLSPAPGVLAQTFDAAHQKNEATYDALGRLAGDGLRQYVFDANSTLTSYIGQDGSASFSYDGLGNRISRTTSAGSETYVLNHVHPLATVAIVRAGGADKRYYIYEPSGRLLYSIEAADNAHRYYHFDPSGSTMMLTDDGGNMTDAYAAGPFGEEVRHQGTSDQPFVFHGAMGVMWERGTTLYNMRRRYYDAASGRFLSRDPIQSLDPLGMNPYQFAYNQPLRFSDPSGLNPSFLENSTGPGVAANVNQLWGDYFVIDPANSFAQGDTLVHIEADSTSSGAPQIGAVTSSGNQTGYTFYSRYVARGGAPNGTDNREPLGTTWGARYLNGGAFDGGTGLTVWRDSTITGNATSIKDRTDSTRRDNSPGSVAAVPDTVGDSSGCTDSDTNLCLNNGRFRVNADFPNVVGGSNLCGDSAASDAVLFFFFDSDNWEMLVKVLDGSNLNAFNHFWVFAAATTDVEYTPTVTDTVTGMTARSYGNDFGPAPAITDTSAFATCP